MRFIPVGRLTALLGCILVVSCSDDPAGPVELNGFAAVQAVLSAENCRSCHNTTNTLYHGNLELTGTRTEDSVTLNAFIDFTAPEQSPLVLRLMRGGPLRHPVWLYDSAADSTHQRLLAYARQLAAAGFSRDLLAAKMTAGPMVDGVAEAAWASAQPMQVSIGGGFAGNSAVTMRAMYVPGERVYFLLEWADPTESVLRAPWLRTVAGWLHESVTPAGFDNSNLFLWRNQPADYLYEDKLAIIWNTTGATAVAGFNEAGCTVLCHVGAFGDARPLKYTNTVGEVADMWHWKLVRTNVVHRLDDQYVYWNRNLSVNSGAGRAGDPGGSEYASNSSLVTLSDGSVVPQYTSDNQPNSPYYTVDQATASQWATAGLTINPGDIARLTTIADTYAVGDRLAYVITTLKPNVNRSDVEAYGVWSSGRWTVEISRPLTTTWPDAVPSGSTQAVGVDVQFVPGQTYTFGVAVFENAQIEHSWSPAVYRLRFQP